jgi:hypothetical protein
MCSRDPAAVIVCEKDEGGDDANTPCWSGRERPPCDTDRVAVWRPGEEEEKEIPGTDADASSEMGEGEEGTLTAGADAMAATVIGAAAVAAGELGDAGSVTDNRK